MGDPTQTYQTLLDIAGDSQEKPVLPTIRGVTTWELTTFLLPMSVGHFRRVLKENPDLPQGTPLAEGGAPNTARLFSFEDVAQLRRYFEDQGRKAGPSKPQAAKITGVMHPLGQGGKTLGLVHMATAAALSGWRVLVIDADPAGEASQLLQGEDKSSLGVLPLIARSYGGHLLRANQLRLDQGETPLPMEDTISRALGLTAQDVIRPGRFAGLDLIAAPDALALADLKLAHWQGGARSWQPWRALRDVLHRDGVVSDYDVIFCDTGAGVGPLSLAVAASCDLLVMPVLLSDTRAEPRTRSGLRALAGGLADIQTRENHTARALGQPGMKLAWEGVHLLLVGDCTDTRAAAADLRAAFGRAVLPDAIPDVPQIRTGQVTQFYEMPPRDLPRAAYLPLREAMEASWTGLRSLLVS